MNIKGRLKVGKYFQTAFGLIGKNIFSKDRVRAFGCTRGLMQATVYYTGTPVKKLIFLINNKLYVIQNKFLLMHLFK